MQPEVKTPAPGEEPKRSEAEEKLVAHIEAQLAELRFSNLLMKSLAIIFLLYTAVATAKWAGELAVERLPGLLRTLLA